MGNHPCPFCLPAGDERAQVVCVAARQRVAQLGLLEENRVTSTSQDTALGEPAADLDGTVAQEGAGLAVEAEDAVVSRPLGTPGICQGTFEASIVLFTASGQLAMCLCHSAGLHLHDIQRPLG
ncbi:MAG: hypothetical protein ACRDP5_02395 [Streptosporangiaceae bacterium]